MNKSAAIRLGPGALVIFQRRRHQVLSSRAGAEHDAPFFRLRDVDSGAITGLISHTVVDPAPEIEAEE